MKVSEAADFVPYEHIGDDFCITSYGDVVFGMEVLMREAYTMANVINDDFEGANYASSEVNLFYHNWKLAINSLPSGVTLQKYNMFYPVPYQRTGSHGHSLTRKWNEDTFVQREVMMDKVFIVVSFPLSNSSNQPTKGGLLSRVNKFKGETITIEDKREFFLDFSKKLKTVFESVELLTGPKLFDLFLSVWNNSNSGSDFMSDVKVDRDGIVIGENHINVLTSRKLAKKIVGFSASNRSVTPSSEIGNKTKYVKDVNLPTSYLFPIGIGMPFEHIIIETMKKLDKDFVEGKLSSEHSGLNFLVGTRNRDAINKRSLIDFVKQLRSDNQYSYMEWGIVVLVKGSTMEESKLFAKRVRDVALSSLGMTLEIENFGAWKAFNYSLPGIGKLLKNLRLGFLETFVYLTHVESFKRGNSDGVMLTDMFGNPFKQSLWHSKYLTAVNLLLFGPTGQGKSVTVNHILDQCYWDGDVIFLIDVGGSYRRTTSMNNGIYIDSINVTNLKFNPFLDCYSKDGKYYPEFDLDGQKDPIYLEFMVSLIMSCWYGGDVATVELPKLVKEMLKLYFESFNHGKIDVLNMNTFYNYVLNDYPLNDRFSKYFDKSSFELSIGEYVNDGAFGFLFNATESIDTDNRWVTFDLKGVLENKTLIVPVILMVLQLFQRKLVQHRGKRIRFWMDEAFDFLRYEVMAKYVGEMYRKIRKEGGQIALITQGYDYLSVLPESLKSSILLNTDIKILMNHEGKEEYFSDMQSGLGLRDDEMELLHHQRSSNPDDYRIAFFKYGNMKAFLARVEISKKTYSLYQTNANDVKLIDDLISRYGNVSVAVEEFVELKGFSDEN